MVWVLELSCSTPWIENSSWPERPPTPRRGTAAAARPFPIRFERWMRSGTAMYQAKRKGGSRHQVIDLREQRQTVQRVSFERDLPGAADRGELRVGYQPIVETADGRIVGVEVLLRWAHPNGDWSCRHCQYRSPKGSTA